MKKEKTELIAELAQGFEGSVKIAKKLIIGSYKGKADAVKFQLVFADEICTNDYKDFKIFRKLELTFKQWKEIRNFSKKYKLKFYVDIFGLKSLKFAKKINADGIKIHPTDINNYELFKSIKSFKFRKIFIGIGGAKLKEIETVIKYFKNQKEIIFLTGFQVYPTPVHSNQISRIMFLKNKFKIKNLNYGFADHSLPKTPKNNISMFLSIGAGAKYIEKHLTIPYHKKLEDHESAYLPNEFKKLKLSLSVADKSFGYIDKGDSKEIYLSKEEKKYRLNVERNFISKRFIKKGSKLNQNHFLFIRSPNKKAIKNLSAIKNKILKKDLYKNSVLTKNHIK